MDANKKSEHRNGRPPMNTPPVVTAQGVGGIARQQLLVKEKR